MSGPPFRWPLLLEGAWYQRDGGWHWYGLDGNREPVPAGVVEDAGLPAILELEEGINLVFLCSEPIRNVIPRRQR